MAPSFEFPRNTNPDPEDIPNPKGITIVSDASFKHLPQDLQTRIKHREISFDDALKEHLGEDSYPEGSYSLPLDAAQQEHIDQIYVDIRNQNDTARAIFDKLSLQQEKKLRDAIALYLSDPHKGPLTPHQDTQGEWIEGPNTSNLYTLVDTVLRGDAEYFNTFHPLTELYQHAQTLESQENKARLAIKYSHDLTTLLEQDTNEELRDTLEAIFAQHAPKHWHSEAHKALDENTWQQTLAAISHLEEASYGTSSTDPRKQGRLTESLLSLINPEQNKERVASFDIHREAHTIWRLHSKAELEEESEALGHCVGEGNTYYFKIRGDNPQYSIFSIRNEAGTPLYTVEYDRQHKNIVQYKGARNSVPSDPDFLESSLQALHEIGININTISEKFQGIQLVRNANTIQAVPDQDIDLDYLKNNPEITCLTSIIISLETNTSLADIELVNTLPTVNCDITKVSDTIKAEIRYLAGGVRCTSTSISMPKLEKIGGDAYFTNLTSAEGLEQLKEIGGTAIFFTLTSAEGLGQLKKIGVNAYFTNLTSAEGLEQLKEIGGDADFRNLTSAAGLEQLKEIGGDAIFDTLSPEELSLIPAFNTHE